MMRTRIWGPVLALLLALVAVPLWTAPAQALPAVQIDFTLAFIPGNPVIPGNPIIPPDAVLTGTARFGVLNETTDVPIFLVPPDPISLDIGPLSAGGSFHAVFQPGNPCLGGGVCQPTDPCFGNACTLAFSFSGQTTGFPTFAFDTFDVSLLTQPQPPPILPIGQPPADLRGLLVAFVDDRPVAVGNFEIVLSAVNIPEPASATLLATALIGLWGRRFLARRA